MIFAKDCFSFATGGVFLPRRVFLPATSQPFRIINYLQGSRSDWLKGQLLASIISSWVITRVLCSLFGVSGCPLPCASAILFPLRLAGDGPGRAVNEPYVGAQPPCRAEKRRGPMRREKQTSAGFGHTAQKNVPRMDSWLRQLEPAPV